MIRRYPEGYRLDEMFAVMYGWKQKNKKQTSKKKDMHVDECLAISDRTVFHTFPSHSISKLMEWQDQVSTDLGSLLYKSITLPFKLR